MTGHSSRVQPAMKRGTDVTLAFLALVLLAPAMAAIALAVVLESRGPVFYRAERVGFRGTTLRMLKFRKMHPRSPAGLALTTAGDARLTRVGRLLVRTRLDELPQFWHVLRGQMSLVGPRPEDRMFVARHGREYEEILAVRPGLTGWSQLAFAGEAHILRRAADPLRYYVDAILPAKVALDRMYAARVTLGHDLRILWFTFVTVVLRQPVAVDRRTGALSLRRRPAPEASGAPSQRTFRKAGSNGSPNCPSSRAARISATPSGTVMLVR